MGISKQFGKKLHELRVGGAYSQEEFAELTGLHRTYISSLERGLRNPTLSTLENIAKALEIEISQLLEGVHG